MNYQVTKLDGTKIDKPFEYLKAALAEAWAASEPGAPVNVVNVATKAVVATVVAYPEAE